MNLFEIDGRIFKKMKIKEESYGVETSKRFFSFSKSIFFT